jgi:hypothetical protein
MEKEFSRIEIENELIWKSKLGFDVLLTFKALPIAERVFEKPRGKTAGMDVKKKIDCQFSKTENFGKTDSQKDYYLYVTSSFHCKN